MKSGTAKRITIGFYTMKTQALRTPCTCVFITFDDDDNKKPPAKETRKQVLQNALEQPFQEPGSVQGHIRTGLLTLYLNTASTKTVSLEPPVTTDRAKTKQQTTDGITPLSRKTDNFVPSTAEKETMDSTVRRFIHYFLETHLAQPDYVNGDADSQTSVVTTVSSEDSVGDVSSSDSVPEKKRC